MGLQRINVYEKDEGHLGSRTGSYKKRTGFSPFKLVIGHFRLMDIGQHWFTNCGEYIE